MTAETLPPVPAKPRSKLRRALEDFILVHDRGVLSPEDRALWEPHRARLVREGWMLSGAIGFAGSVVEGILRVVGHPAMHFGVGSVVRVVVGTIIIGGALGVQMTPQRVKRKRDEFVRSRRLREAMLRDMDNPAKAALLIAHQGESR